MSGIRQPTKMPTTLKSVQLLIAEQTETIAGLDSEIEELRSELQVTQEDRKKYQLAYDDLVAKHERLRQGLEDLAAKHKTDISNMQSDLDVLTAERTFLLARIKEMDQLSMSLHNSVYTLTGVIEGYHNNTRLSFDQIQRDLSEVLPSDSKKGWIHRPNGGSRHAG